MENIGQEIVLRVLTCDKSKGLFVFLYKTILKFSFYFHHCHVLLLQLKIGKIYLNTTSQTSLNAPSGAFGGNLRTTEAR